MTPKDLPELTGVQAFQNTDREVWRETPGDFYSNSVHLTATGGLGINIGGTVHVKPPAEWHRLASGARSTALVALAPEVDDALREVGKWLNEQPNRPIDRVAVAVLCAALSCSTAAQPLTLSHEEIDRVFNDHEEAPQISYRYWVANALLAAANEKSPTAAAQPPGWVDEAAGQIEHLDRENNRLAREAWTWSKACEAATRKLHILSTHHPRLEVRYWTGSYWEPMYGVALDRLLETLAPAPPAASGDSTPPSEPVQGDSLACGHHASLLLKSAETGLPLYCELCDAQSGRRDAETVETELRQQLVEAEETIGNLTRALREATEAPTFDPSGALRPEPEAVGQGRWIAVTERMPENDDEVLVWVTSPWAKTAYAAIDSWHLHREDPTGMGGPTLEMGYMWREYEAQDITHWKRVEPPQAASGSIHNARSDGAKE